MSVRDAVADVLRNFAPIPAERIWGRARNIRIHDCSPEGYLGEEGKEPQQGRQTGFDPDSLGPEGNVWAGSPEDVAEALDKAGLLTSNERFVGYVVLSETQIEVGSIVSSAGSVRTDRSIVESHLSYCRALHGEVHENLNTRYFIAEVREVPDAVE